MATIKFETLKSNCIGEFCYQMRSLYAFDIAAKLAIIAANEINHKTFKGSFELCKRVENEGVKIIERWDIRMARQLIDIFPNAYKQLKNKQFQIDTDENGNWVLVY